MSYMLFVDKLFWVSEDMGEGSKGKCDH